jgi:hypothetical protein
VDRCSRFSMNLVMNSALTFLIENPHRDARAGKGFKLAVIADESRSIEFQQRRFKSGYSISPVLQS